jgi:hypothetical protein
MYVSVFNNGVVLEGNGRETSGSNFELFWVAVGFSKIRTIKFLFVKKSRIQWITSSRIRNQLARKVSHMIIIVVIRAVKAVDTF